MKPAFSSNKYLKIFLCKSSVCVCVYIYNCMCKNIYNFCKNPDSGDYYVERQTFNVMQLHSSFLPLNTGALYPLLDKTQEAPEKCWLNKASKSSKQVWANESRSRVSHPSCQECWVVFPRMARLTCSQGCIVGASGGRLRSRGRLLLPEKPLPNTMGLRDTMVATAPFDVWSCSNLFRLD